MCRNFKPVIIYPYDHTDIRLALPSLLFSRRAPPSSLFSKWISNGILGANLAPRGRVRGRAVHADWASFIGDFWVGVGEWNQVGVREIVEYYVGDGRSVHWLVSELKASWFNSVFRLFTLGLPPPPPWQIAFYDPNHTSSYEGEVESFQRALAKHKGHAQY